MDLGTLILDLAGVACAGAAAYFFVSGGYSALRFWFDVHRKRDDERYRQWVAELALGAEDSTLKMASAARSWTIVILAGVGVYVVTGNIVFGAAGAVVLYIAPFALLNARRELRIRKLEEQIPEAIGVMVASVRAGRSLATAISDVHRSMAWPISYEFGVILSEHEERGLSIERAIDRARHRLGVESFTMVATALVINAGQGGDLLGILERISDATRELYRLQKKIMTETSEVRIQQKVILYMTPLFLFIVMTFDPAIPDILFHSLLGGILLVVVVMLQSVAYLWIRQIVKATV